MKKILPFLVIVLFVFSCAKQKTYDVKSPCVSKESGPCGSKTPINDWWLKNSKNSQQQNS